MDEAKEAGWSRPSMVAFRFVVCYFGLFNLDPLLQLMRPLASIAGCGSVFRRMTAAYFAAWHHLIVATGSAVFHIRRPITDNGWAASDSTHGWLRIFCICCISAALTILWMVLDPRRPHHCRLQEWFRLSLRVVLCQSLISYGMSKVIKTQFSDIALITTQSTLGSLTPMTLMWAFMGSSWGYCLFGGLAEVGPALLLLFRRTTLLGALLAAAVLTNVFLLNLCYDVRVKLYSGHLLLMALVLIVPDLSRLGSFFLGRSITPQSIPPYSPYRWLNGGLQCSFVAGALLMLWTMTVTNLSMRKQELERSPYYGIWKVTSFKVKGKELPLTGADPNVWLELVFEKGHTLYVKDPHHGYCLQSCILDPSRNTLTYGHLKNDEELDDSQASGKPFHPIWETKAEYVLKALPGDDLKLVGAGEDAGTEILLHRGELPPLLAHRFRWITDPEEYMSRESER